VPPSPAAPGQETDLTTMTLPAGYQVRWHATLRSSCKHACGGDFRAERADVGHPAHSNRRLWQGSATPTPACAPGATWRWCTTPRCWPTPRASRTRSVRTASAPFTNTSRRRGFPNAARRWPHAEPPRKSCCWCTGSGVSLAVPDVCLLALSVRAMRRAALSTAASCANTVSRPFPPWNRSMLTEFYLCHACSCPEILKTQTGG
jgi:hypothetical protein